MDNWKNSNISFINILPDEILVQIFQLLSCDDRLNCKTTCRRWFNLLNTSPYFRKDRHLLFDYCIITPRFEPGSIFLNSTDSCFDSLSFENVDFEIENDDDLDKMWNNIGQNLITLDISKLRGEDEVELVLGNGNSYPKLRTLHLDYDLWPEELEKVIFKEVQELHITNFALVDRELEPFLKCFPKLQKIFINSVTRTNNIDIEVLKKIMKKVKGLSHDFFMRAIQNEPQKKAIDLLSLDDFQVEKIKFMDKDLDFKKLNEVLDSQRGLKECKLICFRFPPIIINNITMMNIVLPSSTATITEAFVLPNLVDLNISLSDSIRTRVPWLAMNGDGPNRTLRQKCFFSHLPMDCPQLKKFQLWVTNPGRDCFMCWESLFRTVPNLNMLHINLRTLPKATVRYIFKYLLKLTELHLKGTDYPNQSDEIEEIEEDEEDVTEDENAEEEEDEDDYVEEEPQIVQEQVQVPVPQAQSEDGNKEPQSVKNNENSQSDQNNDAPNSVVNNEAIKLATPSTLKDLLLEWPLMRTLKILTFTYVDKITLEGIKNLCVKCPNLNILHLADFRHSNADHILTVIGTELRYLNSLKYHMSINAAQKEKMLEALDILVQCNRRLKRLELRNQLGVPQWKILQLFQQSKSLRVFNTINTYHPTRIVTSMDRVTFLSSHESPN